MGRSRATIAGTMAMIALLAVGLAALLKPSPFWTSFVFSVALGCNCLAIVAVVVGSEPINALGKGYGICGWAYLYWIFGRWEIVQRNPASIISTIFEIVLGLTNVEQFSHERDLLFQTVHSLATMAAGLTGAAFAWLWARSVGSGYRSQYPYPGQS